MVLEVAVVLKVGPNANTCLQRVDVQHLTFTSNDWALMGAKIDELKQTLLSKGWLKP